MLLVGLELKNNPSVDTQEKRAELLRAAKIIINVMKQIAIQ